MILFVNLITTTCDPGCNHTSVDSFYIAPETLERGVRIDRCLPAAYHDFVRPIEALPLPDGSGVSVRSADYGDRTLLVSHRDSYRTPTIGLSYAYCELCVSLVPPCQPVWDDLCLTCGDETVRFAYGTVVPDARLLDLPACGGGSVPPWACFKVVRKAPHSVQLVGESDGKGVFVMLGAAQTSGPVRFELVSRSVLLNEWDPDAACPRQFVVDSRLWDESLTDAGAALAVADSIARQMPEALEIIARYMQLADDLGSADAHTWLADYYGAGDARYDAYA